MIIHLRLIEANDIPAMDEDKSDAYCVIQLIPQSDIKEKTEVAFNTLSPKWNQEFHIPIANPSTSSLYISMYDKDEHRDDIISTLILPLNTMQVGMIIDQWYQMIPTEQVKKGGILHLITQLTPPNVQPFAQSSQNNQPYGLQAPNQPDQLAFTEQREFSFQQQSQYPQQQLPYAPQQMQQSYGQQQQQFIQQQPYVQQNYAQQPQFAQQQYAQQQYVQQQQLYGQQQYYPAQQPIYQQPYLPQQGQYYTYQQGYPQPGVPYSPYDSQYDIPPPPRPPGMNDENYKKLHKAQKKMLKKLAKGDIGGCFKKGMKYLLKF